MSNIPYGSEHRLPKLVAAMGLLRTARKIRSRLISLRAALLRLIYPQGKFVRCNGARIYVDFRDDNHTWYLGDSLFLEQEHRGFSYLLSQRVPRTVLDIGAHWGIFPALLEADSRLPSELQRVICIEPDPQNIPLLKKTVSLIKKFRVDVIECAVSDTEKSLPAYRGAGSCLQTYQSYESQLQLTIKSARLPAILDELSISGDEITHIKLDIDGYEPAFFMGARDFLGEYRPYLLIEFWAGGMLQAGFDIRDYWNYLHGSYDVTEIVYPSGRYLALAQDHLDYLVQKTIGGVTNLLLCPKPRGARASS